MNTYLKITEYLYLAVALFLTEEVIRHWGGQDAHSFLMLALAVMAFLMYLFKRWYRRKVERENSGSS